jgi:DNA-binding IclR family transcriptional regulator
LIAHNRSGTVGKAFQILDRLRASPCDLVPRTPRTVTSLQDVDARLEQIRALGYETSDREVFNELVAVTVR